MDPLKFKPIGYFQNSIDNPNEAPRQPNSELSETKGVIKLNEGFHFEDALRDLDGFSKIWILFQFHKNDHWNPLVSPPRGSTTKRGVFATRSPYRPNSIGMSVLDLVTIEGLCLSVGPTDLLNGTPILDIKPYLPYADSHPNEKIGWLQNSSEEMYSLLWSPNAVSQIEYLELLGLKQLRGFIVNQMEFDPLDEKKKRLYYSDGKTWLAYRTWRVEIAVNSNQKQVSVQSIKSGYNDSELNLESDPYSDKDLHKSFTARYSG